MITAIVTGSRDWTDRVTVESALVRSLCQRVVQGGARGADALARNWADYFNVECVTFKARWDLHGRSAGPIRNTHMLQAYENDRSNVIVLAFRKGGESSRGTTHCIMQAEDMGFKVIVEDIP